MTSAALAAVEHRLRPENRQRYETLDARRLYCDLLSSMPMCFNLLGPIWADPGLAVSVVRLWFPELCPKGSTVELHFEWSPGRVDVRWLGDRTAFDAVILVKHEAGTNLIGVETKYHEHAAAGRMKDVRATYRRVTERAGIFEDSASLTAIQGTPLEQVWRDHLLALACEQEAPPDHSPVTAVRYVLVAPAANPAWREVQRDYSALLSVEGRRTFAYRTLDALIDAAEGLLPHASAFRERYLDVEIGDL